MDHRPISSRNAHCYDRRVKAIIAPLLLSLSLGGTLQDRNSDHEWRFACIGDSNTWEWGGARPVVTWCGNLAAALPKVRVTGAQGNVELVDTKKTSVGRIGATACPPPVGWPLIWSYDGTWQLDEVNRRGDVDAVIIALGTNDGTRSAKRIEKCIGMLVKRAEENGLHAFVATIPPNWSSAEQNRKRTRVNAWIRATYPDTFIEFNFGFTQDLFRDAIHFNKDGQARAAINADATIRARQP